MFMPKEVFKNNSNNFISNIKETVDVTLATDDDRQLEAHIKSFKSVSFQL
jgi:YbbR domain-containing protein